MKRSLTLALVAASLSLAGCAGTFGHATYGVKLDPTGKACNLEVGDGKEFAGRRIQFNGQLCALVVDEGDSKAFRGQAIGAKVMTVLPVTGLGDLVPAPGAK